MKYDLNKNKKRIKAMAPGTFELVCFIMSLAMLSLSFEFDWEYFGNFNTYVLLAVICHAIYWLIDVIIYIIVKKRKEKQNDINQKTK